MFTEIDKFLYPNKCEVIQTTSHEFIYPIFKNGSTSLYEEATIQNWKILLNNQIKNIDEVTIFLRNPIERLHSGINTFIKHCNEKKLNEDTVKYFVYNYLFLDRHYLPQFFWLINLLKYTKTNVILNLKNVENINQYTNLHENKSTIEQFYDINNINLEKFKTYIETDNFLYQFVGQKITWKYFFNNYKLQQNLNYKHIFGYSEKIYNALPKN
jgi:hypothetical protein